ncbi:hypothetical protein [Wolbachia endosymbiont of Folsomia candida]|uniref:hypothetical protein n=1 Tax=Wolbachia endosymbiont of Folsomia candida TaxID=169402 RepID=UPI000A9288E6|nr:hypothetical protein [Wolbachia endosymbiont of Folsomia candida]APR99070.1 hypothetical protein ASM33_07780 [Wolbachia endosymbiont of Folsomia candida]
MNEIDFINVDQSSSFDHAIFNFGNGHLMVTGDSFNPNTCEYKATGEILDKNYHMIGSLVINGQVEALHLDDHKLSVKYGVEVNLEGDIEHILSLKKA